jgi:hypothetical protein
LVYPVQTPGLWLDFSASGPAPGKERFVGALFRRLQRLCFAVKACSQEPAITKAECPFWLTIVASDAQANDNERNFGQAEKQ